VERDCGSSKKPQTSLGIRRLWNPMTLNEVCRFFRVRSTCSMQAGRFASRENTNPSPKTFRRHVRNRATRMTLSLRSK
jgi:hypothetical protein